jgi:hypothetical protein
MYQEGYSYNADIQDAQGWHGLPRGIGSFYNVLQFYMFF